MQFKLFGLTTALLASQTLKASAQDPSDFALEKQLSALNSEEMFSARMLNGILPSEEAILFNEEMIEEIALPTKSASINWDNAEPVVNNTIATDKQSEDTNPQQEGKVPAIVH